MVPSQAAAPATVEADVSCNTAATAGELQAGQCNWNEQETVAQFNTDVAKRGGTFQFTHTKHIYTQHYTEKIDTCYDGLEG